MTTLPSVVDELGRRLTTLGWVSDLFVAGSLATGDYRPGVSDIDLVAVVTGPVDGSRQAILSGIHRDLDRGLAAGLDLGCVYVDDARRLDPTTRHPTWTHATLTHRIVSGVTRAELLTKTQAIEYAAAPPWLVEHLRSRRRGERVRSPRVRTALIAWRDARRTTAGSRRGRPARDA